MKRCGIPRDVKCLRNHLSGDRPVLLCEIGENPPVDILHRIFTGRRLYDGSYTFILWTIICLVAELKLTEHRTNTPPEVGRTMDRHRESILMEIGIESMMGKPSSESDLKNSLSSGGFWEGSLWPDTDQFAAKLSSLKSDGLVVENNGILQLSSRGLGVFNAYMTAEEERRSAIRGEELNRFQAKWGDVPQYFDGNHFVNQATQSPMFRTIMEIPRDYYPNYPVNDPPYVEIYKLAQTGNTLYLISNLRIPQGCRGHVRDFVPFEWPEISSMALQLKSAGFTIGVYSYDSDWGDGVDLAKARLGFEGWESVLREARKLVRYEFIVVVAWDAADMVSLDYKIVDLGIPREERVSASEPFMEKARELQNRGARGNDPEAIELAKEYSKVLDSKEAAYRLKQGLVLDKLRRPGRGIVL